MTLYEKWLKKAYDTKGGSEKSFWDVYMPVEQNIYEIILKNKETKLEGTVKQLAGRFNIETYYLAGFIDGINEGLEQQIDLPTLEEDTYVVLQINFEKLYRKMVEYKASHLYSLELWKDIFTETQLKNMFIEEKTKNAVVKPPKIGRNDPCTCGSGKKYKMCCGAK